MAKTFEEWERQYHDDTDMGMATSDSGRRQAWNAGRASLEAEIADLKRQVAEREAAFRDVAPTVEFYLKREIDSPSNHQEFAREAEEKLQRFRVAAKGTALDAYVQEKVEGKHHEGACWMLDAIIGSLRGYPDHGGDIQVMTEVQRIVAEAVYREVHDMAAYAANRRAAQHPSAEAK